MSGIIVHEWINENGGAEKVLDAMVSACPDADILALWNDGPSNRYENRYIRETWMARTPLRRSKAAALPLMPPTWRLACKGDYDWALVSSHLFAHHVAFGGKQTETRKYIYAHTPARYIWTPELDERGQGVIPRMAAPALRRLDRARAQEAHAIAANSEYVKERIAKTWRRDAIVIHPPVEVEKIQAVSDWSATLSPNDQAILGALPATFLLGASRFVPYKRLDIVIEAGEASGLPVVLAGSGPEAENLKRKAAEASVPVTVIDRPSDNLLYSLYQAALVFVFPAIEDFGIMPVEAMACGTPVAANRSGGAAESLNGDNGGALIDSMTRSDLAAAVSRAASVDRAVVAQNARRFSTAKFESEISAWIESV